MPKYSILYKPKSILGFVLVASFLLLISGFTFIICNLIWLGSAIFLPVLFIWLTYLINGMTKNIGSKIAAIIIILIIWIAILIAITSLALKTCPI